MNPMLRDVLLIVTTSLVTLAISAVVIMVVVVRGLMEEIERDNARRRR
jgi:cytochrome c biogenesis factor